MKVLVIAAITADGFIGRDSHHESTSWTTKADLQFFVRKTKEIGTVIMGRRTFDTFKKPLKDRRLIVSSHHSPDNEIENVEFSAESPDELLRRLNSTGVSSVVVAGGASIYRQYMAADLVDELYLSVVPTVFGSGISLFDAAVHKELELIDTTVLDDMGTVLLHYRVRKA